LGLGFGFGSCDKDYTLIQVHQPCHLTNSTNGFHLTGNTTAGELLDLMAK